MAAASSGADVQSATVNVWIGGFDSHLSKLKSSPTQFAMPSEFCEKLIIIH